jgi:hypothetical protein
MSLAEEDSVDEAVNVPVNVAKRESKYERDEHTEDYARRMAGRNWADDYLEALQQEICFTKGPDEIRRAFSCAYSLELESPSIVNGFCV